MNVVALGLTGACGAALLAVIAAVAVPSRSRSAAVGSLSALVCTWGGVAAFGTLMTGDSYVVEVRDVLPLAGLSISLDALGAWFVLAVAVVGVAASIYSIGYSTGVLRGRPVQAAFPLFLLSMMLVAAAGSVTTFLVFWELMALTSLVLVLAEHRQRPEVREAGQWYAVMTHVGLVAILLGLVLFAGQAGGESFTALRAGASSMSDTARSTVFVLAFVAFGSKAGVVPLHVWLPRAHPEAPSHVSALMSGAMVKLGIYGIIRVGYDLLGGGPMWWGLLVLGVGATSALFGILHALVNSDVKRLLAYSTTENIGLILIGVGAAGMYSSSGNRALAALALTAALLHVLNHAAFKGLLFLGAGSVLHATKTRDLDRLGGLIHRMPVTAAVFAIGALAIAALPPLNGFVSEWLLLQSLVHSLPSSEPAVSIAMPLAVAAVALTGGLAAATFVKAFGTGFLALPRSEEAAEATESGPTMLAGMILLAGACVALGLVPGTLRTLLGRAVEPVRGVSDGAVLQPETWTLSASGVDAALAPLLVATLLVGAIMIVLVALRTLGTASERRRAENWACGRTVQTARMEYNATSFAEPLQRVFDDVLRPDLDLEVDHREESRYFVEHVQYRAAIHDATETYLYRPAIRALSWWGRLAKGVQNGSIHRYLTYALVAVIVVLVVAR